MPSSAAEGEKKKKKKKVGKSIGSRQRTGCSNDCTLPTHSKTQYSRYTAAILAPLLLSYLLCASFDDVLCEVWQLFQICVFLPHGLCGHLCQLHSCQGWGQPPVTAQHVHTGLDQTDRLEREQNKRSKDLGALLDSWSWDDIGNFLQTFIKNSLVQTKSIEIWVYYQTVPHYTCIDFRSYFSTP